jgi:hypothetical protein
MYVTEEDPTLRDVLLRIWKKNNSSNPGSDQAVPSVHEEPLPEDLIKNVPELFGSIIVWPRYDRERGNYLVVGRLGSKNDDYNGIPVHPVRGKILVPASIKDIVDDGAYNNGRTSSTHEGSPEFSGIHTFFGKRYISGGDSLPPEEAVLTPSDLNSDNAIRVLPPLYKDPEEGLVRCAADFGMLGFAVGFGALLIGNFIGFGPLNGILYAGVTEFFLGVGLLGYVQERLKNADAYKARELNGLI